MSSVPEKDRVEKFVRLMDLRVNNSSENGLFNKSQDFDDLLKDIESVRTELRSSNPNYPKCHTILSKVKSKHDKLVREKNWQWRFVNKYGGWIWIYLIFFLVLIFVFHFSSLRDFVLKSGIVDINILNSVTLGIIGSLLRGITKHWYRINEGSFRHIWRMYFLSVPFIGGMLGGFMYLILKASLIVMSKPEPGQMTPDLNPIIILALAGLAGYYWEWAEEKFKSVGDILQLSK